MPIETEDMPALEPRLIADADEDVTTDEPPKLDWIVGQRDWSWDVDPSPQLTAAGRRSGNEMHPIEDRAPFVLVQEEEAPDHFLDGTL